MSFAPGTRLGPYEITAPLGVGGMGEVYRARDPRLDREVAIKVLPRQYASDPEWQRRLEREARSASSLSHPHICPVYDIGRHDGTDFLVMEYLEGETLAARLARGPLPLNQVLRYGSEICAALEAAHRKGLVHRDLKPGNVMITRGGARLLDFGLAKPSRARVDSTADVTLAAPITAQGTVVGTFQYMSPEQIEGHDVDARSDIFALGAVLYEMATGRRAFDGRTPASVVAAVLEREPEPISKSQPVSPPALDDIVRHCLAKDPDERWQNAHDVRLQIDALRRGAGSSEAPGAPRGRTGTWWIAASLGVAALIALAGLAGRYSAPAVERGHLARLALAPPEGHSFTPNDFAISPDGRRVAFVAAGADGVSSLWVRPIDSRQAAEIRGTDGASWPFWSPDSRWIGFFTRTHLWKVEHDGTGLQTICMTEQTANGGAWGPGDQILFSREVFGSLYRVNAGGGQPVAVTTPSKETPGEAHRFPQWLPDGKRFLYVVGWTHNRRGLYLGSIDGAPEKLVSNKIRSRILLTRNGLLSVDGEALFAQSFDNDGGEPVGEPRTVLRNEVVAEWRFGEVSFSASENGTLVYQPRNSSQLAWFDRSGREIETVGRRGYGSPALSSDGRYVAVTYDQKGSSAPTLWIHDLKRNVATEFSSAATETAHAWSSDDQWIVYATQGDMHRIRQRATDGSSREEVLLESPGHLLLNSATSTHMVYMDFRRGPSDLRLYDVAARSSTSVDSGAEGSLSPDGEWIAYLNFQRGGILLTQRGTNTRIPVVAEGSQVRWRRDMSELYYLAANRKMMMVPLAKRDGRLVPGTPTELFQTRIIQPRMVLFQYDVTADGQKFLINSLPREDAAVPLQVILNWPEGFER